MRSRILFDKLLYICRSGGYNDEMHLSGMQWKLNAYLNFFPVENQMKDRCIEKLLA